LVLVPAGVPVPVPHSSSSASGQKFGIRKLKFGIWEFQTFGKHFRDFEKCSWYYSTNSYCKMVISRQGGQIAIKKGKLPDAMGNPIDLETVAAVVVVVVVAPPVK